MNKLVIFGVGLIGGSLALALRRSMKELHIVGVGRSGESLQNALDLGVINEASTSTELALQGADMVVIAVPVAQTPNILKLIAPHLNHQTVITDVGSTKSDVIDYAAAILGDQFSQFVPGHPIAGAEKSGVSAARADLFDSKNIVLTPTPETSDTALTLTKDLWIAAGARVTEMSASHHDQIFAAVSHLPHLLAFALVENLAMRPDAEELFAFAASGFRDFTRIAGSSPEMWRDISLANRNALMSELESYQASLSALHTLLDNRDAKGLQALFEKASHARNDWSQPSKKS
ncbi:MAG: prephenate dehydrogenase/arogenate dehydrogenase family protein [Methylophilaceae bacterium]|nr:prephenate dehydrogenase/arogenate dehydrogenase family protein [Methylophilaceae bacterium]